MIGTHVHDVHTYNPDPPTNLTPLGTQPTLLNFTSIMDI
jgi:hypothetical protein